MKLQYLTCLILFITLVFSSYSSTDAFTKSPRSSGNGRSVVNKHRNKVHAFPGSTSTSTSTASGYAPTPRDIFSQAKGKSSSELMTLFASSSSSNVPVTKAPHRLSLHQMVYLILTSTFVTCLIVADVIGVKIFEFKLPFPILGHTSVEHTCGMITFPITFLLGDVINEYYGAKATKTTVYIGLAMSMLVFGVMNIAQALPYLQKPFNGKFSL